MKFLTVVLFFFFSQTLVAQNTVVVSGIVRSAETGESIIGATIRNLSNNISVLSNEYGFYSINANKGIVTMITTYSGMKPDTIRLSADKNTQYNFFLKTNPQYLASVVINLPSGGHSVTSSQTGIERMTSKEINQIPQLFGERDPMKAIQLLPGIKPASEGSSGLYVRGGNIDQNLFLLDEAVVYNASHMLGFFSTFNADAVKDVTVYKGVIPAYYGGRLSSVVDVRMNDGNNQQFSMNGGIGLISSRLTMDGPIQKGKSSFIISARSTYIDPILKLSHDSSINQNSIGFYDLNTKLNYQLSEKDQLFLSGYFGNDHLGLGKEIGLKWGNGTGTLRWNHIYNNSVFSNTSLIYSNFDYKININLGANNLKVFSRIRDWHLKQEWQWNKPNQKFRAGFDVIYHSIRPGDITSSDSSNFNDVNFEKRYSLENAVFFADDIKISDNLALNTGLRLESFSVLGPGHFYNIDPNGNILDTIYAPRGKFFKTYFNAEPRISLRILLSPLSSLKAGYGRNTQNLHLINNSTTARPTDRWLSTTNNIKPETSDIFTAGYFKNSLSGNYEFSVETYFKDMQHQIDYRDGADLDRTSNVETQLLYGIGRAYGIEFFARKKTGKFNGWISYTLSKSEKKINGINDGEWYNARQDRTHDISVVVNFDAGNNWKLTATWVYYTGDAISLPESKYTVNNQIYFYYSKRNGYRMPAYHRLDLGATKTFHSKGKFSSELSLGIYNAYGRENAYLITFEPDDKNSLITNTVQTALFRFIPSISYNFKF
ncbi:MAG: carboxypeptidase-like regulatory domain-containing protein [Chitinophagaceae bacterium]|nr:carboxypeptidase-like regulatory domain-containing protein [Chitinophagaceae bacterium]